MGKQQTKHSLPHSANSVDTANELNTVYACFDVRDFSEDCATLCETIVRACVRACVCTLLLLSIFLVFERFLVPCFIELLIFYC